MPLKRKASTSSIGAPPAQRTWFWQSALQMVFGVSIFPCNPIAPHSEDPTSEECHNDLNSTETHSQDGDVPNMEAERVDEPFQTCLHSVSGSQTVAHGDNQNKGDPSDTQPSVQQAHQTERAYCDPTRSPELVNQPDEAQVQADVECTPDATLSPSASQRREDQSEDTSHTDSIYTAFRDAYGCVYTRNQFIGLCAYLSGLLSLGYQIQTADMDGFVRMYPTFARELDQLVNIQVENNTSLTSYHHWYTEHKENASNHKPVLTERGLRMVWSENLFVFLKIRYSMEMVVRDGRNQRSVRLWHG